MVAVLIRDDALMVMTSIEWARGGKDRGGDVLMSRRNKFKAGGWSFGESFSLTWKRIPGLQMAGRGVGETTEQPRP